MQLIINASVMSSLEIPVKCRAFSNFFCMLTSVLHVHSILEPSYFLTLCELNDLFWSNNYYMRYFWLKAMQSVM